MKQVSREEFFKFVNGPRDIHPRSETESTLWEDQKNREIIGLSKPGYRDAGLVPKTWYLSEKYT